MAQRNWAVPLQVRIACATGLVVAGDLVGEGVSELQAILGTTPNLAARLQTLSSPGTLVISDETHALVGDLFEQEDLGLHELKGISERTRVWRVLSERRHESRFAARGGGRPTDLVGRERVLDLLLVRWSAAKSGHGQIALVSGDPGIGKSRLVHTLRMRAGLEPSVCLFVQCSSDHKVIALYPFVEFLERTVLQFHHRDTAAEKLEKLHAWLARRGFDPSQTAPLFAGLLAIPAGDLYAPPTSSPERQKQLTLDALARAIVSQANEQPVLLVVEDLHWADPTTLELLGLLRGRIADARVMLLLSVRPDFQPQWASGEDFTEIALDRLDAGSSSAMVAHIAGGLPLPAEVRKQIVAKADGVPLFVEELTKSVIELGLLREVGGRFELVRPLTPFAMPTTLTDSLMGRLDRLGPAKFTAQIAAILGREFSYGLLRAVYPSDDQALLRDLDQLVAAELLRVEGAPPAATYIFKHALIQDAAYDSLLRRTRQDYHGRVAQVLLAQPPDLLATPPETIARHFTLGGLPALAIPFWTQAGQAAMQRSANLEAIASLTTALDLLRTLPESAERDQQELGLRVLSAIPMTLTRGWAAEEVGAAYRRASELSSAFGQTPHLFPARVGLLTYYLVRGQYGTALELSERNLAAAHQIGDRELILESELDRGVTPVYLGRFEESLPHLDRVNELYDPAIHHHHVFLYGKDPGAVAHIHKTLALWNLGYPERAARAANDAKALTERWIHPFTDLWSSIAQAWIAQTTGDAAAVARIAESIMTQAIEQVFPNWLAQGMVYRGWALVCLGELDGGIDLMRQGLALWGRTGAELLTTQLMSQLADGCLRAGRVAQAHETIGAAIAQAERTDERIFEAELHRLRGEALLLGDPLDVAGPEASFRLALETARRRDQRSIELRAATSLARLWQAQGQNEKARAVLEPVYSWFTEGFATKDLMTAGEVLEFARFACRAGGGAMMRERERLAILLADAAEVEHLLACQYLFVAFSMKRHPDEGGVTWPQLELMRRWEANLLLIARQEMEHLGLVANLLTAIGEAPNFARPNFPIPSDYFSVDDPPSLERFSLPALRRLIRAEEPANVTENHVHVLRETFATRAAPPKTTIGELYREIETLFTELDQADPKSLFIGPPSAQRTTVELIPVPLRGISLPPNVSVYDVTIEPVTDLKSALAVIDQIVREGEGGKKDSSDSHFARLVEMAAALKAAREADPSFEPARPVQANPTADAITNPAASAVFDVFESAYETTILLLLRYFGQTDELAPEVNGLQQAVFFPMMTTILRPLGDILTQLPARDDGSEVRAGPAFTFARRLAFLPHREAAWRLIGMRLDSMAAALKQILESGGYSKPVLERLTRVYENMARIASDFRLHMLGSVPS